MHLTRGRTAAVALVAVVAGLAGTGTTKAALFTDFTEAGTPVNGYQDDFTGTTRNAAWKVVGADRYTQVGDGTLRIETAPGDPNKLLYDPVTPYSATAQEVLALMRVNTSTINDGFRSGVATLSDPTAGDGINLHFREVDQNGPGKHFNLLDDRRAWGPATAADTWQPNTYYWLRLAYSSNAPAGTNNLADGANDAFGKVWRAGTGEPAGFQIAWDRADRAGLAGLAGTVADAVTDVSVDYILIKAEGLPSIQVVPEPASAAVFGIGALGLLARRRRR